MSARHALEHVFEIGEWLDVVELGGGDEGADRGPAVGAPVGSGEQVILAAKRDGTNRALDGVGIKFDASVIKEAAKSVPAVQATAAGAGLMLDIEPSVLARQVCWQAGPLVLRPRSYGPG